MATLVNPITDPERAARQAQMEQSIHSVRLEGLEPSDAAKAIFNRYVSGELTLEEMGEQVRSLHVRRERAHPT